MRALSLAFLCLVAAGCRVDPNIVLLERENRELEDRIYQLEDALARTQGGLEACQATSASPPSVVRPRETPPPREAAGPALVVPQEQPSRQPDTGPLQPPAVLLPSDNNQAPSKLPIPQRRPVPGMLQIPGNRNESDAPRGTEIRQAPPQSRRFLPSGMGTARTVSATAPAEIARDNRRIQQIVLHPMLTGGYNADGRPGHEGITTLVEFRDAKGRLLSAAAPVSVAVVDKAVPGPASRVARWDFSPQDVAALWRKTPMGEGLLLQLRWPEAPPTHGQLRLYVRLTTDDGRKLDAIRDIEVQIPESATAGWSPASPKVLPTPDKPAVPLAQARPIPSPSPSRSSASPPSPQPPAAEPPPAQPPAAEPVEAAAAPILELPDDGDEPERKRSRDSSWQADRKRPAVPETALQRPTWSPYRR